MSSPIDSKPSIVVSDADHRRLSVLASGALDKFPDVAEELQSELERARVVPADAIPDDVVRMGSVVEFRSDLAPARRIALVFPQEADIAQNRVSVLTPVGTALIGLTVGQSISWIAPDGRTHALTVVSVERPWKPAER